MTHGWMGQTLDIDLTSGEHALRDSRPLAREWLGGRALATRLALDLVPPNVDAFAPENPVIIAGGPLTGTLAPTTGRVVMTSVTPRSYPRPWYTHSTIGGWVGPALKYAGLDALIVRGAASRPMYLEVSDAQARLHDATDLWGLDARETQLRLRVRHGAEAQVLAIGQAGEHLVRFATVQHSEENAAGHSGFGAVWGSKRLKAIVAHGTRGVTVADPAALLQEVRAIGTYRVSPLIGSLHSAEDLHETVRPVCSQACTFNCIVASYGQAADGRRSPGFCIGPIWVSEDGMRLTSYSGGGVEVPPGRNFGKKREGALHELCNNLGLDLWFRLVTQPWLIACRQAGVDAIRGHPIWPDDSEWFASFMVEIAHRQGLGALFADDLRRAMDALEGDLPDRLIRLGRSLEFGFGFPAHREGRFWDEEPLPFWVISAMMYTSESRDPTIGTHQSSLLLADYLLRDREHALRQFRRLGERAWGNPAALEPSFEGKAGIAMWSQHQHILVDSLPLCDFAFPRLVRSLDGIEEWRATEDIFGDLDHDRRLLAAVTGVDYSREELDRIAERAFTLERLLLARFGRDRHEEEGLAPHFRLPCRADGTSVDGVGFGRILDEYYDARGWDRERGWPTAETLARLDLMGVV